MKKLLILIVLFTTIQTYSSPYLNSELDSVVTTSLKVTKVVDDFTNQESLITEKWRRWATNNGRSGIGMFQSYLNGNAKAIDLMGVQLIVFRIYFSGDLGCLSDRSSEMMIKLDDGQVITLYHLGETDCDSDGQSGYYSPIRLKSIEQAESLEDIQYDIDEIINALSKSKVVKIRLTGSQGYTEQVPPPKYMKGRANSFFIEHIAAIKQYE